jgi:hypothetical protein
MNRESLIRIRGRWWRRAGDDDEEDDDWEGPKRIECDNTGGNVTRKRRKAQTDCGWTYRVLMTNDSEYGYECSPNMGLRTKNCWVIYPKENGEMRLKVGWINPKRVIINPEEQGISNRGG